MAEEYSRKAVFEILGQEVPDKEMKRAESYAISSSSRPR